MPFMRMKTNMTIAQKSTRTTWKRATSRMLWCAVAASIPISGHLQDYPRKPIRVITAEAGGGSDFAARLVTQERRMHAHDIQAAGAQAILTEQAGLDLLHKAMADRLGQAFAEAAALILSAQESGQGRVIVSGMGKSGHVGRKIAATLASTGTPAYFVHPAEASHGDLGMIQTQDVILALSWSGETSELSDLIAYAKRFRVPLIGITAHADSALARESKIVLVLPKATEACPNGIAPTTSTTMQMALGDALAVALLAALRDGMLDEVPLEKIAAFRLHRVGASTANHLEFISVTSSSIKPRLTGRQPSTAVGCSG